MKLYYHPAPNPAKVALFLEEAGLPYELVPVDGPPRTEFRTNSVLQRKKHRAFPPSA